MNAFVFAGFKAISYLASFFGFKATTALALAFGPRIVKTAIQVYNGPLGSIPDFLLNEMVKKASSSTPMLLLFGTGSVAKGFLISSAYVVTQGAKLVVVRLAFKGTYYTLTALKDCIQSLLSEKVEKGNIEMVVLENEGKLENDGWQIIEGYKDQEIEKIPEPQQVPKVAPLQIEMPKPTVGTNTPPFEENGSGQSKELEESFVFKYSVQDNVLLESIQGERIEMDDSQFKELLEQSVTSLSASQLYPKLKTIEEPDVDLIHNTIKLEQSTLPGTQPPNLNVATQTNLTQSWVDLSPPPSAPLIESSELEQTFLSLDTAN